MQTVKQILDKEVWEAFVATHPEANFLQSWNWGLFQENLGKKVFRLALEEDGVLVAGASCVKEEAKRGTYLAIGAGPLISYQKKSPSNIQKNLDQNATQESQNNSLSSLTPLFEADFSSAEFCNRFDLLFTEIRNVAKQESCQFIRLRPQFLETDSAHNFFNSRKFQTAQMHLTADLTLQLNLNQSEEEILAQMRKNTRYEIRRSEKEKIRTKISSDPDEISLFYEQQVALAKKHQFVPFSYEFLHEQFKAFVCDNQALLIHAFKENEMLASAFVIFYGHEAVYHYGVSTDANARLPGSYACQWEAIKEAKRRGVSRYNFWGIAPKEQSQHRFAGVSIFKRGFGGAEIQYVPALDFPLSSTYVFTKGFELLRHKIRKL